MIKLTKPHHGSMYFFAISIASMRLVKFTHALLSEVAGSFVSALAVNIWVCQLALKALDVTNHL